MAKVNAGGVSVVEAVAGEVFDAGHFTSLLMGTEELLVRLQRLVEKGRAVFYFSPSLRF
jgi:hypothetical protein